MLPLETKKKGETYKIKRLSPIVSLTPSQYFVFVISEKRLYMIKKLLFYYNSGKSHLRVISNNAALPIHNNDEMFTEDDKTLEFSVTYDTIDDILENMDTIVKNAVESIINDDSFDEKPYKILTAHSEQALAEYHINKIKKEEKTGDLNDLLSSVYKIVGS